MSIHPFQPDPEFTRLRDDYRRIRLALLQVVTGEGVEPGPGVLEALDATVRKLAGRSDGDESRMALQAIAALRETQPA